MNTLVTGANGFLGRYVAEQLLARGDSVRAYIRRPDDALESLGAEIVLGDLREEQKVAAACERIDTVFHVAGVAGIWGPWECFHSINTLGSQHVLNGCIKHQVPKLVYTSSPSVTFAGEPQEGVDASAPYPTEWLAHYPHSKALAEEAILKANGQNGLLTTSLRPHLIWGPRDNHLVPRLLTKARSGRLRRVGDGTNLVDMVYVENAAAAHLAAADALGEASTLSEASSPPAGKAYFLSQGEPVNCWTWIDEILALANLPPIEKSISTNAAKRVGKICEGVWKLLRLKSEPPMTRFLAAQLGTSHWFDISSAKQDFGYSPMVSTEEGMKRLGDWLKQ